MCQCASSGTTDGRIISSMCMNSHPVSRLREAKGLSRAAARSFAALRMTGLDLAGGEELSRSFEPCLSKQNEPGYVSTEQIQGVRAIIDEVDAGAIGDDSQTEEAASSGRRPSVVYQFFGDLGTAGRCFYDSAVVAVRNQNIPVGSDGETERVVNRAVGGDI